MKNCWNEIQNNSLKVPFSTKMPCKLVTCYTTKTTFGMLCPYAYHAGLRSGSNGAKETNFVDFLWVDVVSVLSKSMEKFPYQRCVVPVEFVLWRECIEPVTFIEGQLEYRMLVTFAAMLAKELQNSILLIVQKTERKIAHFTNNNVGRVEVLSNSPDRNRFICSICKRETFFRGSVGECGMDFNIFCINHCTSMNWVCNVPLHREDKYCHLHQTGLERKLIVVRNQMKKSSNQARD